MARLRYGQEHADELEDDELSRQIANADVDWDEYDNDRLINPYATGS